MHDIYDSSLSHTGNTGLKTHSEASYNAIEEGGGGGVKRSSNFSTLNHILIGNGT